VIILVSARGLVGGDEGSGRVEDLVDLSMVLKWILEGRGILFVLTLRPTFRQTGVADPLTEMCVHSCVCARH
jgi:hypothetical protein